MNSKQFIIFAMCVVACYSTCVPDPIPVEGNNQPLMVGNLKPINTSSDNVVQLIHFLNEFKYNQTADNENLLIVSCKLTQI